MDRQSLPADTLNELGRILMLDPAVLNDTEVAFLRARADYLTKAEREDFSSVLTIKKHVKASKSAGKEESE